MLMKFVSGWVNFTVRVVSLVAVVLAMSEYHCLFGDGAPA